jgi:hypothetical protein
MGFSPRDNVVFIHTLSDPERVSFRKVECLQNIVPRTQGGTSGDYEIANCEANDLKVIRVLFQESNKAGSDVITEECVRRIDCYPKLR